MWFVLMPHFVLRVAQHLRRAATSRLSERLLLLAFALLMLASFTSFRPHPFLVDDNVAQWNSIAEFAFSELFAGHFPTWAPYQWAGFRIDEVGYYGLYNPFMLLSYVLRQMGLTDMMTLYVFMMYGIGILAAHALCEARGLARGLRVSVPLAYGCSAGYLLHSVWYYVYSVFALGAVMMWTLHGALLGESFATRMRWSAANGCVVALMFYLGNAQLACYVALGNYGIASFFWLLSPRRRCVTAAAATSVAAMAVALAPVARVYGHAADGAVILAAPRMFEAKLLPTVVGLFVPHQWASSLLPEGSRLFSLYGNAGGGALAVLASVFVLAGRGKQHPGTQTRFACSCWLTVALFIFLARGPTVLEHIPTLSRFRMAFKWLFVVPPMLMAAAAVAASGHSPRLQRLGTFVCLSFIATALARPAFSNWGLTPKPLSRAMVDQRPTAVLSHRIVFASWQDKGPDAHIFTGFDRLETEHLLANAGTSRRTPTLSGYNLSLDKSFHLELGALLGGEWYMGAGVSLNYLQNQPAAALRTLRDYAVSTLLVQRHDLHRLPQDMQATATPWDVPNLFGVAIANTPALVTNSRGEAKEFSLQGDGLTVSDVSADDGIITARWWHLPGFVATFESDHQTTRPVMSGVPFLQAEIPVHFAGTLKFVLRDNVSIACFVVPYALLLCMALLLRPQSAGAALNRQPTSMR